MYLTRELFPEILARIIKMRKMGLKLLHLEVLQRQSNFQSFLHIARLCRDYVGCQHSQRYTWPSCRPNRKIPCNILPNCSAVMRMPFLRKEYDLGTFPAIKEQINKSNAKSDSLQQETTSLFNKKENAYRSSEMVVHLLLPGRILWSC